MKTHYQVLIIGGGTAGIMVAAQLRRKDKSLDIGIIEPADTHYYQPAWTLVGAGTYDYKKTAKPMKGLIPKGVEWIQDYATGFKPEQNQVDTKNTGLIGYDYLVVAPGLVMEPSMIEGLPEALDKGVVCSNYTDPEHTWDVIRNFKGGNALFTQPGTPIKCGGAPQKIAYMAADYFRKKEINKSTNVIFATPGTVIFGLPEIRATLEKVLKHYGMHFKPFHTPFKIDAEKQIAYFHYKGKEPIRIAEPNHLAMKDEGNNVISIPFDMLHLAPPQAAPKFVRESSLANDSGWMDVDPHSLQHVTYKNIFSLGDVAGTPAAKTGAAIRKQVPTVVDNVNKLTRSQDPDNAAYNGYSSCPIVTGYGKMVLAEFDYDNNFTPDPKLKQMLVFDSSKESWKLWILKKYGLPYLYWKKMMKGKEV